MAGRGHIHKPPSVTEGKLSPRTPPGMGRLVAVFLSAALLTGAVVVALYRLDLNNERALFEQAATSRVGLHADLIRREVKAVESDLLYLANQVILADFLAGRPGSRRLLEDEYVLFCRHRGVYDQIRYLDADGVERVRVNDNKGRPSAVAGRDLQPKAGRYYFARALGLGRGEVFLSPFDLNVEHDAIERPLKPVLRFATPVFDRQGGKRGILVLNYLGTALLGKLDERAAGFAGQVWLVNRDGFFLRGPSTNDEWGFMLGHDRTLATYFPDEWPRFAAEVSGQFRTRHGLFTFRTLAPRAGLPPGPDAGAAMIVVAHVPPDVLDGRALQLLRRLLVLSGVVLVLVFVLSWYLACAATLRRAHERHLAESEARLRALSTRLLTAQEDERRSLSRDLHDELGQIVTSVTLDLQRAIQAGDPTRKDELIARGLHGAGCLLDHLHEISARLRPMLLDDLGLKEAVRSFLGDYERRTGIATRAELCFEQTATPPGVSENIYRILQEALTNVSKHAHAAEVFVNLRVAGGQVSLTVRDAGIGLEPAALDGKRLGILGMRERAELLDGTFVLEAQPGRGTEVRVTIPLAQG